MRRKHYHWPIEWVSVNGSSGKWWIKSPSRREAMEAAKKKAAKLNIEKPLLSHLQLTF